MNTGPDTFDGAALSDGEPREAVACTLSDQEFRERRAMVRTSLVPHILDTHRTETGLVVLFPNTETMQVSVETFTGLERQCCGFLTFDVEQSEHGLTLVIEGPPHAQATLDALTSAIARE